MYLLLKFSSKFVRLSNFLIVPYQQFCYSSLKYNYEEFMLRLNTKIRRKWALHTYYTYVYEFKKFSNILFGMWKVKELMKFLLYFWFHYWLFFRTTFLMIASSFCWKTIFSTIRQTVRLNTCIVHLALMFSPKFQIFVFNV